ncbi:hypothetical protein [Streptomyces aureocirculatus]|uniref:hypothetical protein n=1 Tax=Streptomyces aureocirculatus TaxID=67275 RepID=UPI000B22887B|nr:hypothetical protein [Streptomyces aureocirculatus]
MAENELKIRVVEYWPNEDQRIIFAGPETERTANMSDDELISEHEMRRRRSERHLRAVE